VRGLGWFPNDSAPRVFWAGIDAGPRSRNELRTFAHATEQSLAAIGVPVEEREFNPHLTLARRRDKAPIDLLRKELAVTPPQDFGRFSAESFFLYLSKAGSGTGPERRPLHPEAPEEPAVTGSVAPQKSSGKYVKLHEFPLVSKL
jgi:2'-5' RNA ligase